MQPLVNYSTLLKIVILCSVVLLAFSPIVQSNSRDTITIRVVTIYTDGSMLTPTSSGEWTEKILNSYQWWYDRAPTKYTYEIAGGTAYYDPNVYVTRTWDQYLLPEQPNLHQIIIVYGVTEITPPSNIHLRNYAIYGDGFTDAQVIKSVGNMLYNLFDLYPPAFCGTIDIMCDPEVAYRANRVGCETLRRLGAPCQQVHLPVIVN